MKVNSSAIYATRPIAPYKKENICFTQNKRGNVFLFYLAKEDENKMSSVMTVESITTIKGTKITMLGSNKKLKRTSLNNGFYVEIPDGLRNNPPSKYAWTLMIDEITK